MKKSLKNLVAVSLVIGSLALNGCATTSGVNQSNIDYDLQDTSKDGDYKLIRKDNDIFLEKIDGSESRQITHTPYIREYPNFTKNEKYIVYFEEGQRHKYDFKYFIVPIEKDDSSRKEISELEWRSF